MSRLQCTVCVSSHKKNLPKDSPPTQTKSRCGNDVTSGAEEKQAWASHTTSHRVGQTRSPSANEDVAWPQRDFVGRSHDPSQAKPTPATPPSMERAARNRTCFPSTSRTLAGKGKGKGRGRGRERERVGEGEGNEGRASISPHLHDTSGTKRKRGRRREIVSIGQDDRRPSGCHATPNRSPSSQKAHGTPNCNTIDSLDGIRTPT